MQRMVCATFMVCTLVLISFLGVSSVAAVEPSTGLPAVINPTARYLIFHHNYYVEAKGVDGDCKYHDILKSFRDSGFVVVSEIRPKDASALEYAKKSAAEVRKLLDAGVPPERIALAGHSKGAVIALQVAAQLGNPKISYAVLAGCGIKGLEKGYPDFGKLQGNFLSVYAASDKIATSCAPSFAKGGEGFSGREIVLDSPAGHQLFFKPAGLWVEPVVSWLKQQK